MESEGREERLAWKEGEEGCERGGEADSAMLICVRVNSAAS
jgi:hypothetical protein